jgi:uncharacterized Ntn-hydrolase superfamily protein
MTFSIAVRMGDAFGVAVASRFIAVGAVVPAARIGVGAVATQAMARVASKAEALATLDAGGSAADAVRAATAADDDREHRQLGVVGRDSQATFTGRACMPWAGGVAGEDDSTSYAIQGNILVGSGVVTEMESAWLAGRALALPHRLMATLVAGDAAGGDRRGRQAAAMYAVAPGAGYDQSGVLVDLRVDDHPQAPSELARLLDEHDLVFGSPEDVQPLEGALAQEVRHLLTDRGHATNDLHADLAAWAGEVNLEMRLSPDGIDRRVLEVLRQPNG